MSRRSNKKKYRRRKSLTVNIIGALITLIVVFGVVLFLQGYISFSGSITDEYSETAIQIGKTALTFIDGNNLPRYLEDEGYNAEWEQTDRRLKVLCNGMNAAEILVCRVDTSDYNSLKIIFDAANEERTDHDYTLAGFEVTDEKIGIDENYKTMFRQLYEKREESSVIVEDSDAPWILAHLTAVVPVKDDAGNVTGLVAVMLEMRHLNQYRVSYLKAVALETAGLAVLTAVIAFFYTRRRYIRPVKKIIKETRRFAAENTKTQGVGDVGSINEYVELARSVDAMEVDISNYIENITHITAEKERADAELSVAKTIQTNAVPNTFPAFPERADFDIFASMTSAKQVGGDFYNFFLIDDDRLAIMIGDVSGKGVPAALFMMQTNILLTDRARSGGTPAEILRDVNNIVCRQNQASMFVTVWLGMIELSTGRLTAASAGHDDPAVYRKGGVFELVGGEHGLFIGAFEDIEYENYEIRLGEGDKVFIYTDGVHEAVNANEEMFTVDRMLRSLNEVGTQNPERILDHVKSSVAGFVGDVSQFDDQTMLCFERKTSGGSRQTLCVNATLDHYADVIAFIDKFLEQNGCDEENRLRVQLAVDEIFTNIVNYAYGPEGGKVEIAFSCKDGMAEITFADHGMPYDPLEKDDPDLTLSPEEMPVGGLGVFIAKNNMDAISYRYENDRNILTMSKNIKSAAEKTEAPAEAVTDEVKE